MAAYDFVEKPLSLAKLLRTVGSALDARSRRPSGKFVSAVAGRGAAPIGRSRAITQLRSGARAAGRLQRTAAAAGGVRD